MKLSSDYEPKCSITDPIEESFTCFRSVVSKNFMSNIDINYRTHQRPVNLRVSSMKN